MICSLLMCQVNPGVVQIYLMKDVIFFSCLKVFHTDFHSGLLYTPTVSVQRFSFFIRPCYRKLPAGQRPTFTHIHSLSIWAGRQVSYPEGAYRIYSDLMKQ